MAAGFRVRGVPAIAALLVIAAGCATTRGDTSSSDSTTTSTTSAATSTLQATPAPSPQSPSPVQVSACSPDPMAHVYNPERLHVLGACVTVAGSVRLVRSEPDGDYHIDVVLDQGQLCAGQDCLTDANRTQQSGALVVEIVCAHDITQADAAPACIGYHTLLPVPAVGQRLTVTGPWVFDTVHGWNEIHPAESFGATAQAASPAPAPAPGWALSVAITGSRYGYIAATTSPGATCSATAKLPSGRTSTATGLQAQPTAGADGSVSWTYGTSSSTRHGTGTHTVTCTLGGRTATASAPFTVG